MHRRGHHAARVLIVSYRAPCAALAAALLLPTLAAALEPANEGERLMVEFGLREAPEPVSRHPGWRVPKKIVVDAGVPGLLDALRTAAPGVKLVAADSAADMALAAAGADAVIGRTAIICDERVLAAGRNLRWLQTNYAGVDACSRQAKTIVERRILLTNMRAIAAPVIAEHVIAFTLALSRGLYAWVPRREQRLWAYEPGEFPMIVIQGKTMLVAGLGGIGSEVAKRAHALGMRVIATRATRQEKPDYVDYVGTSDELKTLVSQADVVVNAMPLTPETTGTFDAALFARMKRSAYFINVGRGMSVVTADLTEALQKKIIAGAGLDVTDPEPLPPDNPLWQQRNLILTPHVSAQSDLGAQAEVRVLRENLRRYVAGEKMLSVVDVGRGY